jgi:pyruvate formate lyase activating enzyme
VSLCGLCFHRCDLREGQRGICRARICRNGNVVDAGYGVITSLALDPIEKKPLRRFHPGSVVLSVGSYGCNLRCPFCQNAEISMSDGTDLLTRRVQPEELVALAKQLVPRGNIGIAYTYNEPTVSYEFVRDCAELARGEGMLNVLVTNGSLLEPPLKELLPCIDAMNVDLKGFTEEYYRWLGGDLETVKNFIRVSAEAGCHLEVTTLIVPGKNDSDAEICALAQWLASVDSGIALHLTRFFPQYKMSNALPTKVSEVYRLADIARKFLRYVYVGNC